MCISCPKRVLAYEDGRALVEFQGRKSRVRSPVPLRKGEYVLCQAGFVVKKVPESEAREMLKEWSGFDEF